MHQPYKYNHPDSVTSIGSYAFGYCENLLSITVSSGNAVYDSRNNCNAIIETSTNNLIFGCNSTVIPDSVTIIGDAAFYYCNGLTNIAIPENVISIGADAFHFCTSLTSISIPSCVTSIADYAFAGCSSLESINIGGGVKNLGKSILWACESLTSITVSPGNANYDSRKNCNAIIEKSTNTLIAGCKNTIIPNGVTSIGDDAFDYCTSLTSIIIPDSIISIGEEAFYNCTGLISITIPDSVTSIGNYAFYMVPNIIYTENMTATGSPWDARCVNGYVDGNLVYKDSTKTELCACSSSVTGSITIPDSVTSLGTSAFGGCNGLTSIAIPDSITSIGASAFGGCNGLTCVTIPNSVESIGDYAFYNCTSLTSVIIPDSITSIADGVFSCSGLTSITIPNSVTSIGNWAFDFCTSLISITIPSSVTCIGDIVFYHCTSLTSITIPDSVTSIGNDVFDDCPDDMVIIGYADTCAQEYAEKNNITFIDVETHSHSYTSVVTPPTCTAKGYTTYTCECGDSYVSDYTEMVAHSLIHHDAKAATCTEDGHKSYDTCSNCDYTTYEAVKASGHSFTWVYNNDATTEKDGTETQVCSVCSTKGETRTKEGTKLLEPVNPNANAVIHIAEANSYDYRTIITIEATATDVDEEYYLAIYIGGKEVARGDNKSASYKYGELKADLEYEVKVVDKDGNVAKDGSENFLSKQGEITCNKSFFKRLIAFFKSLFGLLPKVTVKPD